MSEQDTAANYPTLNGRGVLVSGGATGIGAAIVAEFVRQNARVAFIDVDTAGATQLVESLADAKHPPAFFAYDVTKVEALPTVVTELANAVDGIQVLVNNAANDDRHAVPDVTPEYWRSRMAVNLDHQFFMSQAVAPFMKSAGGGSIVNMGSCSWRLGLDNLSAYVTAKAGIEGLTNGLARELGEAGIRVNCVVPGFIKTQRQIDKWLTPELEQTVLAGQCLKQLIDPLYVARLVAFLAADDSAMCSSGTYTVDAGWI